jgi:hypothetical protein
MPGQTLTWGASSIASIADGSQKSSCMFSFVYMKDERWKSIPPMFMFESIGRPVFQPPFMIVGSAIIVISSIPEDEKAKPGL